MNKPQKLIRLEELNAEVDSWSKEKQEKIMRACIEGARRGVELTTSTEEEEIDCLLFIESMEVALDLSIESGHQ